MDMHPPPSAGHGRRKFVAVPEIRVEKRFGDRQLIVGEVRIGQRPDIQKTDQHCGGDGSNWPIARAESWQGNRFAAGGDQGFALEPPGTPGKIHPSVLPRAGNRVRDSHRASRAEDFQFA